MIHSPQTPAVTADFARLWPDTAQVAGGRLAIGGCDVERLCQTWGTPLYILDEATFRAGCRAYVSALAAHYPGEASVHYAAKALFNTTVARWVAADGLGLDAASAGEVYAAPRGGVAPAGIHLHGNAKPCEELEYALAQGVGAIVADNLDELALTERVGATLGRPVSVILRIAPGVGADTHPHIQTGLGVAKFGLLTDHLPRAATMIAAGGHIRLAGLHFHIGSQIFDLDSWAEAIEVLLDARALMGRALGELPAQLSPGGGLGVPYASDDPPSDIAGFVAAVSAATVAGCATRAMPLPRLVLEPGRSIAARAGVAAYTVIARKDMAEAAGPDAPQAWLHLDGGMADNLRPALYGARYEAALAARMDAAANPKGEPRRALLRIVRRAGGRHHDAAGAARGGGGDAGRRRLHDRHGQQLQSLAPAGRDRRARRRGAPGAATRDGPSATSSGAMGACRRGAASRARVRAPVDRARPAPPPPRNETPSRRLGARPAAAERACGRGPGWPSAEPRAWRPARKGAAAGRQAEVRRRIFTVTVRPKAPAPSHQAKTSSARAATAASISAGRIRSAAKVVSEPDDLRGRSATTGRSSSALATPWNQAPGLAEAALQEGQALGPQVRAGEDTQPVHRGRRDRSHAGEPAHGQGLDEGRTGLRRHHELAVWLATGRASLARSLL